MRVTSRTMSVTTAARELGCAPWQLRRLFERGLAPDPERIGQYRIIRERDLPRLRRALESAGYVEAGG